MIVLLLALFAVNSGGPSLHLYGEVVGVNAVIASAAYEH